MGKLIDSAKRARAKAARGSRKRAILEIAGRAFVDEPFVEITLDEIGRRSGVAQGMASLYFGSREELFLKLMNRELDSWADDLATRLEDAETPLGAASVADLVACSVSTRSGLATLLAVLPSVLEQNTAIEASMAFASRHRDRLATLGAVLERTSAAVGAGRGLVLLARVLRFTAGCAPFARPKGALSVALASPGTDDLAVDLRAEIELAVREMLVP